MNGPKSYNLYTYLFLFVLLISTQNVFSQSEDQENDLRPVRYTFESIWLAENQTVDVPFQGTFEMDFQHRFGTMNNGYGDYFGLAAPSNIRMGFVYVPIENLQVGFGITKERKVWDFSAKYALLKQKRRGGLPISISYYVVAGIDTRDGEVFEEGLDRFSYFHQLMLARKLSDIISIQVAPSISYFNFPDVIFDSEGNIRGRMENMHFSVSYMGKISLSEGMNFIFNYDQPYTTHEINDPKANASLGFEFVTSSHAFQLFIGNYKSIIPQYNHVLNQNNYREGTLLLGFNVTRLWNF